MSHLLRPFTQSEIRANLDKEGFISGNVVLDLADVIDRDLEGFLDLISEKLVDSSLLMDVGYEFVGKSGDGRLVIKVTGDPSDVLDDEDEEETPAETSSESPKVEEDKKLSKYSVLVKRVLNVRIDNIVAESQTAAIEAVSETVWNEVFPEKDTPGLLLPGAKNNPDGSRPTIRYFGDGEETSEYLVDEEGDEEYERSQWYESDGVTLVFDEKEHPSA